MGGKAPAAKVSDEDPPPLSIIGGGGGLFVHVKVTLISNMDPSYSQEGLPVLSKVDHVVASILFDPGVDQIQRKAKGV
jgi:hypothetical protein